MKKLVMLILIVSLLVLAACETVGEAGRRGLDQTPNVEVRISGSLPSGAEVWLCRPNCDFPAVEEQLSKQRRGYIIRNQATGPAEAEVRVGRKVIGSNEAIVTAQRRGRNFVIRVKVAAAPRPPQCTDSDGGSNYYKKGNTKVTVNGVVVPGKDATDYCPSSTELMEYICKTNNDALGIGYKCPYGCSNGACLTKPTAEVEIGTRSDLLELGETIGDVRETLTERDLPMLKGGSVIGTKYNQYLRFPQPHQLSQYSMSAVYAEDERDIVDDYLYVNDGDQIFEWEIEFEQGLESKVVDYELPDIEGAELNILGKQFVIVDTSISPPRNSLKMKLMTGSVSSTLKENDISNYIVNSQTYEVEVLIISETANKGKGSVKFKINGEITSEMTDGDVYMLANGLLVGVADIMISAGRQSVVQFMLDAYQVEIKEEYGDRIYSPASTSVNAERIEDSELQIIGQFISSGEFEIQTIKYRLLADAKRGDMFVPEGQGIRSQLDEPEGMLTPGWDIIYDGLKKQGVTAFKLNPAGDDEYDLEFVNQEGIYFDFPLASNEAGSTAGRLKYGDDDDDLWFTEFVTNNINSFVSASVLPRGDFYITDDDFFVVSNCHIPANNACFSHVLRYNSIDKTNNQLTFTDVGTGTREVTYDSTSFIAELVVGGITYRVGVDEPTGNLIIDLNGDGSLLKNTEAIIGIQGKGLIDLGEQRPPTASLPYSVPTTQEFDVQLITLAQEFDEAQSDEIIGIVVKAMPGNEIDIDEKLRVNAGILFGPFDPAPDRLYAMSGFGVFFNIYDPASGPMTVKADYPRSQVGATVIVRE